MSDSYKVIEEKLKRLEPFRGNSLRAYWDTEGTTYKVISWDTEIATYYPLTKGRSMDTTWYSVSTSTHQRLIARAWGFPPLKPKKDRLTLSEVSEMELV